MNGEKSGSVANLRRVFKRIDEKIGLWNIAFIVAVIAIWVAVERYRYDILLLLINTEAQQNFSTGITTKFGDFMTLTFSILVEALPFVILGVLISTIIQVFLPTDKLVQKLPKNTIMRRAIISCLGIFMPVCECGNVPVARGLIAKGFSTSEAVIFLLCAPSVNFITFIVTWEAFNQNTGMAVWRVIGTIIIANIVALILAKSLAKKKHNPLTKEFTAYCEVNEHAPRSIPRATNLFRSEMWLITRLLIIGAMIAAASQIFIPREIITAIGSDVILSVIAMLALAFVISICSSVDAFFALAYVSTFSYGSILAFLVAGPMVDIKMIALMKSTFTARTIAIIASSVLVLTFILGVVFSYVW